VGKTTDGARKSYLPRMALPTLRGHCMHDTYGGGGEEKRRGEEERKRGDCLVFDHG